MGRDPLLIEFVQREPILTSDERDRILKRARHDPEGLRAEARAFWWYETLRARGTIQPEPEPTPRPVPPPVAPHQPVPQEHVKAFREWRLGVFRPVKRPPA